MNDGRGGDLRFGLPVGAAVLLHVTAVAALVVVKSNSPTALPPIYKVNIVAAPPGPSAIGVVKPAVEAPSAPVPPRAEKLAPAPSVPAKPKPAATKAAPREVTPTPPVAAPRNQPAAPAAGGGPTGGKGTDVANVRTEGIDFPFPGYLNNIVRQIKVRFKPPGGTQRAEVMFILHRDGSVSNLRFLTRSGSYEFDLEAQGAIEAAASSKAFGALPDGFPEDALPIVFSFDPQLLGR